MNVDIADVQLLWFYKKIQKNKKGFENEALFFTSNE